MRPSYRIRSLQGLIGLRGKPCPIFVGFVSRQPKAALSLTRDGKGGFVVGCIDIIREGEFGIDHAAKLHVSGWCWGGVKRR